MDSRLEKLIHKGFATVLGGKTVVCLDIPDVFQFMQPELIAVLTERLIPHLGAPETQTGG